MKTLAKGIYQIDTGKANVFLLEGKEGLALVDAGVYGVKDKLKKVLLKSGFALKDIKHILVTHAHVDHVGGLKELQIATRAQVWAHSLDTPFILRGEHPPYPDRSQLGLFDKAMGGFIGAFVGSRQPPAPVHNELEEGDILSAVRKNLLAVHLPGHSPGQIGFWLPEERVLLGGDVMMHLLPWLHLPLGAYTPDMDQAKRSVQKVAMLKPQTLGLGHGAPLVGDAEEKVAEFAGRLEKSLAPTN